MQEIQPNLYIGSQQACDELMFRMAVDRPRGWRVLHATSEPCHHRAVGCHADRLPRDHPEYLVARRGNHLLLNLLDAPVEVEIPPEIFRAALAFIEEGLAAGDRVLVHCNQGMSRSAGICLLYLKQRTDVLAGRGYEEAERLYEAEIYPHFRPGRAIRDFLRRHWESDLGGVAG